MSSDWIDQRLSVDGLRPAMLALLFFLSTRVILTLRKPWTANGILLGFTFLAMNVLILAMFRSDSLWRYSAATALGLSMPFVALAALRRYQHLGSRCDPVALIVYLLIATIIVSAFSGVPERGAAGITSHPNTAALAAALGLALSTASRARYLGSALFAASTAAGIATQSQTFIISWILLLPAFAFYICRKGPKLASAAKTTMYVSLLLTVVPLVLVLGSGAYIASVADDPSELSRVYAWTSSLTAFATDPLLGSRTEDVFLTYIHGYSQSESLLYAHNIWLTFFALGGIALAVTVISLVSTLLRSAVQASIQHQLAFAVLLTFSAVEYALQFESYTWLLAVYFSVTTRGQADPEIKRSLLHSPVSISRQPATDHPHPPLKVRK